jgi:hypothetical protein
MKAQFLATVEVPDWMPDAVHKEAVPTFLADAIKEAVLNRFPLVVSAAVTVARRKSTSPRPLHPRRAAEPFPTPNTGDVLPLPNPNPPAA